MGINFWGVVQRHARRSSPTSRRRATATSSTSPACSVWSASPTQSAYNAAKFAVRGFSDALRIELEIERADVSVTTIHPGGIKHQHRPQCPRRHRASTGRRRATSNAFADEFDRLARTTPDKAARQILKAVRAQPSPCPDRPRRQAVRRGLPSPGGAVPTPAGRRRTATVVVNARSRPVSRRRGRARRSPACRWFRRAGRRTRWWRPTPRHAEPTTSPTTSGAPARQHRRRPLPRRRVTTTTTATPTTSAAPATTTPPTTTTTAPPATTTPAP